MYPDDWLLAALSEAAAQEAVSIVLQVTESMGFLVNWEKSVLSPTRRIRWLGMISDSCDATVGISRENVTKIRRRVLRAYVSLTMTRRQWESLIGSLSFAAEVTPLGRLRLRRLIRVVNTAVPISRRDEALPVPRPAYPLLRFWLDECSLPTTVPWRPPPPSLRVTSDASDVGWGFQSDQGHQEFDGWTEQERILHINVRELLIPLFF